MIPELRAPAAASRTAGEATRKADLPERIADAAHQFEALLIGQLLHSMRGEGGWLGTGDDATADCAADFAEQQFAAALSAGGGLGLASLIASGLDAAPAGGRADEGSQNVSRSAP